MLTIRRTKIGDPDFLNASQRAVIADIPTKELAGLLSLKMTDDRTHPPEYYNPEYSIVDDHGTSHSSMVDKNGMAVSITSSVNWVFGSCVMDNVTGVLLDNTVRVELRSNFASGK